MQVALAAAAGLVGWAERHGHPTGTADDVLDRRVVEGWAAADDGAGAGTRNTQRINIGLVEAAVAALRPDQAKDGTDDRDAYRRSEIDTLLAWADRQTDPARRHELQAALAVGLGTGLRPAEQAALTGHDVARDASGAVVVTVTRGGPTRRVPALAEHEDQLEAAAARAGGRWLIDPSNRSPRPDDVRDTVRSTHSPAGVPYLTPLRCRLTWVRAHLASVTRVDTLQDAAGLDGSSKIRLWLATLDPLPPEQQRSVLRGI